MPPNRFHLKFRQLSGAYAVVRFRPDATVPACPAENVPPDLDPGPRWMCLKLEGPFPFSQTGVLLSFIEPLSKRGIPIFAISTYDTDYVLIPEEFAGVISDLPQQAGHELIPG